MSKLIYYVFVLSSYFAARYKTLNLTESFCLSKTIQLSQLLKQGGMADRARKLLLLILYQLWTESFFITPAYFPFDDLQKLPQSWFIKIYSEFLVNYAKKRSYELHDENLSFVGAAALSSEYLFCLHFTERLKQRLWKRACCTNISQIRVLEA